MDNLTIFINMQIWVCTFTDRQEKAASIDPRILYTQSDLVFSSCKNYKPWPGRIKSITIGKNVNNSKEQQLYIYKVAFIGHSSTTLNIASQLEPFNEDTVRKYRERYRDTTDKQEKQILRAIELALKQSPALNNTDREQPREHIQYESAYENQPERKEQKRSKRRKPLNRNRKEDNSKSHSKANSKDRSRTRERTMRLRMRQKNRLKEKQIKKGKAERSQPKFSSKSKDKNNVGQRVSDMTKNKWERQKRKKSQSLENVLQEIKKDSQTKKGAKKNQQKEITASRHHVQPSKSKRPKPKQKNQTQPLPFRRSQRIKASQENEKSKSKDSQEHKKSDEKQENEIFKTPEKKPRKEVRNQVLQSPLPDIYSFRQLQIARVLRRLKKWINDPNKKYLKQTEAQEYEFFSAYLWLRQAQPWVFESILLDKLYWFLTTYVTLKVDYQVYLTKQYVFFLAGFNAIRNALATSIKTLKVDEQRKAFLEKVISEQLPVNVFQPPRPGYTERLWQETDDELKQVVRQLRQCVHGRMVMQIISQ